MTAIFPNVRMRRYRQSASIRALTAMPIPTMQHFIWPVFVVGGTKIKRPIPSLPNQYFLSIDYLLKEVEPLARGGIGGVLVFAELDNDLKSIEGEYAWSSSGLVQKAVQALKSDFPDLTVFSDVGLSGYTTHGHNGIINKTDGSIDNDLSLNAIVKIATSHADAGVDCVAPSGMMDGQVKFIREAFNQKRLYQKLIMSYSVKFMSNLYHTFPYAVDKPRNRSPLTPTYLAPPDSLNQALREAALDEQEGADFLMVKPALFYLDIIAEIRRKHLLPIAGYNVSGEYSMIHASSDRGWGDLYPLAKESLMAIWRSGADILISYWANQYDKIFLDNQGDI